MAVITISRQLGAGGSYIAEQVAGALGYELIDATLIAKAAESAGMELNVALSHDEYYESPVYKWLKSMISPSLGKIIIEEKKRYEPEGLIDSLNAIIRQAAEKGNIVIVGRASQFILKDFDNAFHVQIIADIETRVKRIMEKDGLSRTEALEKVKTSDEMRTKYILNYFSMNKNDPIYYNLIINTTKLSLEEATFDVIDAARRFGTLREYIPGVKDRRKEEDRRSRDRRRGLRREIGSWTMKDVHTAIIRGRSVRRLDDSGRRLEERRNYLRRKEDQLRILRKKDI